MTQLTDGFGKPIKQQKCVLVPEYEYTQLNFHAEQFKYKKITSNEELIPGNYYWVRSKSNPKGFFFPCLVTEHAKIGSNDIPRKAIIVNEMDFWAYEGNSQALERYFIYGPIPIPIIDEEENSSSGC